MKTKCYCIGCKLHPLHSKRGEFDWVVGYEGGGIYRSEDIAQGADVECLEPDSDAFTELGVYPEDLNFPITAYGDGASLTFAQGRMFELWANCGNEEHED